MMKEIPPHRIIYIMGTGRSGTTILEILLSANNDICSVGELTHIFRDGFGRKKSCACGQPFNQCVFWSRVNKYLGLSQQMFLKCRYLFNRIDWHLGFLKQLFMAVSDKKTSVYNQINNALYKACADASGKPVIVDSSKYPSRALMLSKLYGGSAKIICLTRSPEGLFAAFKKNDIEQPAKSSLGIFLYYAYVLLCCRITALITKNVFFITFEELIMYPVKTIKKIEAYTGISFEQTIKYLEQDTAFTPGHIITGNRLRYNKSIFFKRKQNFQYAIPKHQKPILILMKTVKKILRY